MIYEVSLPLIIILAIFGIIIILARKIPDISLEAEVKKDLLSEQAKKQHRSTVLFCKALSILEKTLRQLRIHILKLDAKIFSLIQYLRDKSAKKLEEINNLSYKSFAPTIQKKSDKPQSKPKLQADAVIQKKDNPQVHYSAVKPQVQPEVKPQLVKKDVLPENSSPVAAKNNLSSSSKVVKTLGHLNKISLKFQFNIEERKLLHIIAKNPKNAENYKKLGVLYYENENFLDAEAAFEEYIKLNPSDIQIKEMLQSSVLKNQNAKKIVSE
jgi:tetratricopeptide (TPR) repeat protein